MKKFRLDPLSKVVKASIIDTYSDIGAVTHRYSHWAARGLRLLVGQDLRLPIKRVLLPINKSSMTASLPIDFDSEVFVGYIVDNKRVPIFIDKELINTTEILSYNRCNKCGGLDISEDFNTTQTTGISITYQDVEYTETITKKLFSSGDYWLIKKTPYLNSSNQIAYRESKEFIANLKVSDCGCIVNSDDNINVIKSISSSIANCNFTERTTCCNTGYGGYNVFEDSGLIQLDHKFKPDNLYLEYRTFMSKVNGEYQVPRVAFETLVAFTKFKAVENKPNALISDRSWHLSRYEKEKRNMNKILGRVKLSYIIKRASMLPKFDVSNRI